MARPFPKFWDPKGQPIEPNGLDTDLKLFCQVGISQERILDKSSFEALLTHLFTLR